MKYQVVVYEQTGADATKKERIAFFNTDAYEVEQAADRQVIRLGNLRPAMDPAETILRRTIKDLRAQAAALEATLVAPPPRGVLLVKSVHGYDAQIDGRPLGMDTSWSDADRLCKAIATRRPAGETVGYGKNYHRGLPFGATTPDPDDVVQLGVSVREYKEKDEP